MKKWLLPEGIHEQLPQQAKKAELTRRLVLDHLQSWGYQLVNPPMLEFIDALATGTARELEQQTFKVTDQLTGKMMGIRSDHTPQVARIDAHKMADAGVNRLCYSGVVLYTRNSLSGRRSPQQFGAECFGHVGLESDLEMLCLLLSTLSLCGINDIVLDMGHVAILSGVIEHCDLSDKQSREYLEILSRKSIPDLALWLTQQDLSSSCQSMLAELPRLNGDAAMLDKAEHVLSGAGIKVVTAINVLRSLHQSVKALYAIDINFDLAELRGYNYHTGIVFAAYVAGSGENIARGGRYDGVGEEFGNARPATGFSADMPAILQYGHLTDVKQSRVILAPSELDAALMTSIAAYREAGDVVIHQLGDSDNAIAHTHQIVNKDGAWQLIAV